MREMDPHQLFLIVLAEDVFGEGRAQSKAVRGFRMHGVSANVTKSFIVCERSVTQHMQVQAITALDLHFVGIGDHHGKKWKKVASKAIFPRETREIGVDHKSHMFSLQTPFSNKITLIVCKVKLYTIEIRQEGKVDPYR